MSDDHTLPPDERPATGTEGTRSNAEPSWVQKNSTLMITIIGTIFAAVLSGIFALAGSRIGADGAYRAGIAQQQAVLDSTRAEEARKKRGEVYAALLESADSLLANIDNIEQKQTYEKAYTNEGFARLIVESTFDKTNRDFRSKQNQVYVYGSDEGLAAATELSFVLTLNLEVAEDFAKVKKPNSDEFSKSYDALRRVMCREASAQPRTGCA